MKSEMLTLYKERICLVVNLLFLENAELELRVVIRELRINFLIPQNKN